MGEEAKSWCFWHRTNLAKHSLAISTSIPKVSGAAPRTLSGATERPAAKRGTEKWGRGKNLAVARQILGRGAAVLVGEWERGWEGGLELFFVN